MQLDRENEAMPRSAELCLSPETNYSAWDRAGDAIREIWLTLRRGRPEECYELRTLERLARGELIDTLGLDVRDEAATRRKSERWLAQLIALGLRPDHLCIEYGCGSLWCAEPVIRYLNAGRFVGLDVTNRFYALGSRRLGALLDEKQVHLDVISAESLRSAAALAPDFVFSHRVLHHVPRRGLRRYMRSLCSLLNPRTVLVIEHRQRPLHIRGGMARRHEASELRQHLRPDWICVERSFGFLIAHRDRLRSDPGLERETSRMD